ncbi:hypothetical protein [Pseudarthrobacter sp. lyk4-40-TYG-27]|uniref:hypothetical protein n=1 Tax=Pseudarthrobacter sp. lyk4-40-TYG-27 TaxID=3040305 RepID=UPI0025537221|nr:hypothetical protein [Pseudarthrobacter sp. lyk4-40-TYG-27]
MDLIGLDVVNFIAQATFAETSIEGDPTTPARDCQGRRRKARPEVRRMLLPLRRLASVRRTINRPSGRQAPSGGNNSPTTWPWPKN